MYILVLGLGLGLGLGKEGLKDEWTERQTDRQII